MRALPPLRTATLGALELNSIVAGIEALDFMLKEAPVTALHAGAASPGKYLILLTGGVEDLQRALSRGLEATAETRIDDVLLPAVAAPLERWLTSQDSPSALPTPGEAHVPAIGAIETFSAPTLLGAVDTALKTGETSLEALHLLQGIGGKATAAISGDVESVRTALAAASQYAGERQQLARQILIPHPDPGVVPFLQEPPQGSSTQR